MRHQFILLKIRRISKIVNELVEKCVVVIVIENKGSQSVVIFSRCVLLEEIEGERINGGER